MYIKCSPFIACAFAMFFSLQAQAQLKLSSNQTQVTLGENIKFDLILDLAAGETLTGLGLTLDLSEAQNLVLDNTTYANWLQTDDLTDLAGLVNPEMPLVSGPGQYTLATFTFKTLAIGAANVNFKGQDGGLFEGLYFANNSYKDTQISFQTQVNAVPEPEPEPTPQPTPATGSSASSSGQIHLLSILFMLMLTLLKYAPRQTKRD